MVLCRRIPSQITLPLRFRDRCTDPSCWATFRVWNDLQTVKKEGQEKELQVIENNTIGKSKQFLHFSQADCSGHPSAWGQVISNIRFHSGLQALQEIFLFLLKKRSSLQVSITYSQPRCQSISHASHSLAILPFSVHWAALVQSMPCNRSETRRQHCAPPLQTHHLSSVWLQTHSQNPKKRNISELREKITKYLGSVEAAVAPPYTSAVAI